MFYHKSVNDVVASVNHALKKYHQPRQSPTFEPRKHITALDLRAIAIPTLGMDRFATQVPARVLKSIHNVRPRLRQIGAVGWHKRNTIQTRRKSTDSRDENQVTPLTGYWADILNSSIDKKEKGKDVLDEPLEKIQPVTRTAPEPLPAESLPKTDREERVEKARLIFGSPLSGPIDRRSKIDAASRDVAGVKVPPKPEEPDNCCMSGCINCVWDVYRDDLEEWATKSAEARERLQAQRAKGQASGAMLQEPGMPSHVAVSMDDDGGGSETNWNSGLELSGKTGDLFEGIPVGIREFMRTEKMLKQKHSGEKRADS